MTAFASRPETGGLRLETDRMRDVRLEAIESRAVDASATDSSGLEVGAVMARILVAYGTSEGQTAAIAERIGDALAAEGHDATLVHAKHPPAALEPSDYDGVIVGASIHVGTHQRYVGEFVREHLEALNRGPTAFFSVSLTAAHADPNERESARELFEGFLEETGWEPDRNAVRRGRAQVQRVRPAETRRDAPDRREGGRRYGTRPATTSTRTGRQ